MKILSLVVVALSTIGIVAAPVFAADAQPGRFETFRLYADPHHAVTEDCDVAVELKAKVVRVHR